MMDPAQKFRPSAFDEREHSHHAATEWRPGPAAQHVWGRILCFGSPVIAALVAASCSVLMRGQGTVNPELWTILLIGNAAFAALGSGVGAALRPGHIGVRVAGGLAYGVLALFIYGIALGIWFTIFGLR